MALPVRRRVGVWDPFGPWRLLGRDYDDVFEAAPSWVDEQGWTPLADVEETDDAWVVELEVPGVDRDDLEVEVHGRQLSVSGERREKERNGELRRRGRPVGRFVYAVTLGTDIDPEGVTAHLNDGELHVRVPKHVAEQARKVEITS